MKLYLAGPLFTQAEQNWLRDLKSEIEVCAKKEKKQWAAALMWSGPVMHFFVRKILKNGV